MAESERYKWAVEQHRAISELSEKMQASGGLVAKLGCVFREYAERIMREHLLYSERMHYQDTMIARTAAHGRRDSDGQTP